MLRLKLIYLLRLHNISAHRTLLVAASLRLRCGCLVHYPISCCMCCLSAYCYASVVALRTSVRCAHMPVIVTIRCPLTAVAVLMLRLKLIYLLRLHNISAHRTLLVAASLCLRRGCLVHYPISCCMCCLSAYCYVSVVALGTSVRCAHMPVIVTIRCPLTAVAVLMLRLKLIYLLRLHNISAHRTLLVAASLCLRRGCLVHYPISCCMCCLSAYCYVSVVALGTSVRCAHMPVIVTIRCPLTAVAVLMLRLTWTFRFFLI